MTSPSETKRPWLPDLLRCDRAALGLAVVVALFHLATARGYGIFRDELYYLACAQHLDWGYVDHPPFGPLMVWVTKHTLGTSLFALRLWPALAAGLLVWLTAAIARQLGGGPFAQRLAGLTVALAPIYVAFASTFSINSLDLVVWSLLLLLFVRILARGEGQLWLLFGVVAGVGLQNKLSVLFLGAAIGAGLLAARRWDLLRDRRLWLGAGLAVLLFLPHVLWQARHGFPVIEFIARATAHKNVAFTPLGFFGQQIQQMNPVVFPLWAAGLGLLLFHPRARSWRALGWTYPVVFALLMLRNAKPYYLAPIYPALLAAGSVGLEGLLEHLARAGRWLRPASLAVVALGGAVLAPLVKPLLSEDDFVAYARRLGQSASGGYERHRLGRLPQYFADMHGWPQLAQAVAAVYQQLPAADRARACVYTQNYGQAGAIDFYGPALGLPPAISGHNSYFLWGLGSCSGEVLIVIGGKAADHGKSYAEVTPAARFSAPDTMPYESDLTLYVLRSPRRPLAALWPRVKHFD